MKSFRTARSSSPAEDQLTSTIAAPRRSLKPATETDAAELAALHTDTSAWLTAEFGVGPWTGAATERGVLFGMRTGRVYVARRAGRIVGTLRLATRKPWAIDRAYFTPVTRQLFLTGMAVAPRWQRTGLGRRLLDEARLIAAEWPADSICLDAWDATAGAGGFYARCGYRETGRVSYKGTPLIYFELLV